MKKRKKPFGQYIVTTVLLITGMICGNIIVRYSGIFDTEAESKLTAILIGLVSIYGATYLHTILHEGGHLLFGLLTGYGFSSFRIGSLMIIKKEGKLRFSKLKIAGTGGQCLMTPPGEMGGRFPCILYNMGGVIVNIVLSAVFFILYAIFPNSGSLSGFLLTCAIVGVSTSLVNGIPLRLTSVDNDGRNALSLVNNDKARRAFAIQLKVSERLAAGERLGDMPEEWFEIPAEEDMKNNLIATMAVFAANRFMDTHDFARAKQLIERLLNGDNAVLGLHLNLLRSDLIYLECIGEKDETTLNSLMDKRFEKFMKASKTNISILRTRYAFELLVKNHLVAAAEIKERFEKAAGVYPYKGDVMGERELVGVVEGLFGEI